MPTVPTPALVNRVPFPTTTSLLNDTFARANTSVGAPGNSIVGNGWVDLNGSTNSGGYSITSNTLIGHIDTTDGSQFNRDYLVRPNSETSLYNAIEVTIPAGFSQNIGTVVRKQNGAANCYFVQVTSSGVFTIFKLVAGSPTSLRSGSMESFSAAKAYTVRVMAYPTYGVAGSTTIWAEVRETATGVITFAYALPDTTAGIQTAGVPGVVVWGSGGTTQAITALNLLQIPTPRTITYIGDSTDITLPTGAFDTTAQMICTMLTGVTNRRFLCNNQGNSGKSSTDWLPAGSLLTPALVTAAGCDLIDIRLGANDAAAATLTSKATYKANMLQIVNAARVVAPVIIHDPWYFWPETNSLFWLGASAPCFTLYSQALDEIAAMNLSNVYRGQNISVTTGRDFPDLTNDDAADGHPEKRGGVASGAQIMQATYNVLLAIGKT